MSIKKYIPKPNTYFKRDEDLLFDNIENYSFCNCKKIVNDCVWPYCICDVCLNFKENCECTKDDK